MGILESLTNNATETAKAYLQMAKEVPGNLKRFAQDPVNYLGGAAQNFSKQMQDPVAAATSFGPNPLMMRGMVIPAMGRNAGRATRISPADAVPEFDISNLGASLKDLIRKPIRNELWEREFSKSSPKAQQDFIKQYFPYWGTDDAAYKAGLDWTQGRTFTPGKQLTAGEVVAWPEYYQLHPGAERTPIFPWESRLPEGAWESNPNTGTSFMGGAYNPSLKQLAPLGTWVHELGHEASFRGGRKAAPIENFDMRTMADYLQYLSNPDEARQFLSGMYHYEPQAKLPRNPYELYDQQMQQLLKSHGSTNLQQPPSLEASPHLQHILHGKGNPADLINKWDKSYLGYMLQSAY